MQNLPLLDGSLDDSACQNNFILQKVLVRDHQLGMQFLIIFDFTDRRQQVKEIGQQVNIFSGHIGDQENGNNIFGGGNSLKIF